MGRDDLRLESEGMETTGVGCEDGTKAMAEAEDAVVPGMICVEPYEPAHVSQDVQTELLLSKRSYC